MKRANRIVKFGPSVVDGHDVPVVIDNPDATISFGRKHVDPPSGTRKQWSRNMTGFSHLVLLREDNQGVPIASTTLSLQSITKIEVQLEHNSDTETLTFVDMNGTDVELTTTLEKLSRNTTTGVLKFPSGRKFRVNRVRLYNGTTLDKDIKVEVDKSTHVRVIFDMADEA